MSDILDKRRSAGRRGAKHQIGRDDGIEVGLNCDRGFLVVMETT
jgi:hypothetical protein